ncbi:DEAD/DEAH box helicase [Corynebacterium sp. HS2168-gen11]|uniref:DEAD/DEAH box helicase n=1 Tax=Corynebacterium sp. HS2168-gen11 TaxID=2974027 RepID=UPI00216B0EB3|nr:DEAD/DEAH box helicase [Corynebacterium sp. HS2168-gen11]MCS4535054.1 DEAD/DEAH box helicase [Corynebacterium sp. HS2168-gen11]
MINFSELGLPAPIVQELSKLGIDTPFPIQAKAIPDALAGKDILGRGPTGSGKTFTFGLPMLAKLSQSGASKPKCPRGLVLVPTRELAAQVRSRLEDPARVVGLRVLEVVGGVNINTQIRALAAPVDVLVATPGRAQDLHDQGYLDFSQVEISALDEADHMSDMGFLPQVRKLLRLTPKRCQRLLFSATLDGDVDKIVAEFMHNPVTHATAKVEATVSTMQHFQLHVGTRAARNEVVARIAGREGKTIMFMRTKYSVDKQVKKLRKLGIHAVGIHGDKGQHSRTSALAGFADTSIPVLVATDIAARGIDISDVDLVVHVDPPAEHKAYVHRAGRTARAGSAGMVVTLVTDEQRDEVAKLLRKAGVTAPIHKVHPDSEILVQLTGAKQTQGHAPLPSFGQMLASQNNTPGGQSRRREAAQTRTNERRGGSNRKSQGRRRSNASQRRTQTRNSPATSTWGPSSSTRRSRSS